MLELILCWLNRPKRAVAQVVDTDDGPACVLVCSCCGKDHP